MGWAASYIERLKSGETIQFRPRGHSMTGRINDGQLVTVEPIGENLAQVNEIVLCRVSGSEYLHLVKARQGGRVLIGNNKGGINGWTSDRNVYGRVISNGQIENLKTLNDKLKISG